MVIFKIDILFKFIHNTFMCFFLFSFLDIFVFYSLNDIFTFLFYSSSFISMAVY